MFQEAPKTLRDALSNDQDAPRTILYDFVGLEKGFKAFKSQPRQAHWNGYNLLRKKLNSKTLEERFPSCKGMWGRKGSSQVAKMAPCTCASEFGNWRGSREGDSETDFQHFWHRGQAVGESQTPAAHPIWVPFWGSLGASTGAFWVLLGPVGPPWGAFNASLGCHFGQLEGQQGGG